MHKILVCVQSPAPFGRRRSSSAGCGQWEFPAASNLQWLGGSEGARGIQITYIFPIQWGAKELLKVSQPSNSLYVYILFHSIFTLLSVFYSILIRLIALILSFANVANFANVADVQVLPADSERFKRLSNPDVYAFSRTICNDITQQHNIRKHDMI